MPRPERVHGLLAAELRAAPPRPSEDLRERVVAIASGVPPSPSRPWHPWPRRVAFVLAPVAAAAAVVAIVAAVPRDDGADNQAVRAPTLTPNLEGARESFDGAAERSSGDEKRFAPTPQALTGGETAPLAPGGRRLQDYRATLTVRVPSLDDLSPATTQAMRITRSLGGYVVTADYGAAAGGEGDSLLVVRVPASKVSEAVLRFSELGTVTSQQVSIKDLQATYNAQTDRIHDLRNTIATLRRELRGTGLTPAGRADLQGRLANAERLLQSALNVRQATQRRGRLAQVSLTLTTREGAQPVAPSEPGRFEQTLRDALGVLGALVTWLLAGLIVAGPFLALAVGTVALERRRRRRADRRLLEQTG